MIGDEPLAVRGPIERGVVDDHWHMIARELHIEIQDDLLRERKAVFERAQGILRALAGPAAIRSDCE